MHEQHVLWPCEANGTLTERQREQQSSVKNVWGWFLEKKTDQFTEKSWGLCGGGWGWGGVRNWPNMNQPGENLELINIAQFHLDSHDPTHLMIFFSLFMYSISSRSQRTHIDQISIFSHRLVVGQTCQQQPTYKFRRQKLLTSVQHAGPNTHEYIFIFCAGLWRGVKSRSPDPGCDSIWKLLPASLRREHSKQEQEKRGVREWVGERDKEREEAIGAAENKQWGRSDGLMFPLVSVEHQLTWFSAVIKLSNFQPYNGRDNDILNIWWFRSVLCEMKVVVFMFLFAVESYLNVVSGFEWNESELVFHYRSHFYLFILENLNSSEWFSGKTCQRTVFIFNLMMMINHRVAGS